MYIYIYIYMNRVRIYTHVSVCMLKHEVLRVGFAVV